MKRLYLSVFALLFGLSLLQAQQYEVFGGLSLPSIAFPETKSQHSGKSDVAATFHTGVRAYFNLNIRSRSPIIYGIVGLEFNGKGYSLDKYKSKYYDFSGIKLEGRGYSLDVPVHFGVYVPVTPDVAVLIEGGPTPSFGLFGKWKRTWYYSGNEGQKSDGQYYDRATECGFKRIDAAMNASLGVEIQNKYTIRAGMDFGLINLTRGCYPENAKSRNLRLSVGYRF
ncbi:MAG: outer membrane beta-barrel protein [Bacteroidales bacterium]|nr:outer membrane beta-barrel protein [Bacteroidales bacterium]MBP5518810.1 outer membrane beta-barrel protein [Bacteroidales bacterium]